MIFFELFHDLIESRSLVDVRRDDLEVSDIRGFILGLSTELVLIGVVGDDIQHDGYAIIQLDDVSFLRWGTDKLLGWEKVLEGPRDDGMENDIDLSNWSGAIESARSKAPLVTFHREKLDSSTCYITDRFENTDLSIVGRQITTDGQRNGSFAIKTEDLTRIDLGGRYEAGLKRMLDTV
ncbi:hypothetical protein P12x_000397 [Tundrisphaera lichenicola]|uniref:hypothetical protein n=1 Tax=Tundrisphaera lichenicola TaxID=2029860 RepID=UPI003EBFD9D1